MNVCVLILLTISKHTQIPRFYLGMLVHGHMQAVDARPFISSHVAWVQGYGIRIGGERNSNPKHITAWTKNAAEKFCMRLHTEN